MLKEKKYLIEEENTTNNYIYKKILQTILTDNIRKVSFLNIFIKKIPFTANIHNPPPPLSG